ncbi:uncharacterized protein TNCT_527381 [Trichonephila clavata]|uniref:Uncharacterized protein n=1 Tax=Trichonephila clavata TaxID=2740835 RepID=A0A8X6KLE0_TRICU|nr:uncharacterized protein TNCT_527381 [Trichonephila clavata]
MKQRGVIRFLAVEGVGGRDMHRRMKALYDGYSLCSSVVEWRELLEDDTRPGQAHWVITLELNTLVLDNHRNTVDEIHWLLGISVGTTHTIMHQQFNFGKLCAHWVSHQLTREQCDKCANSFRDYF